MIAWRDMHYNVGGKVMHSRLFYTDGNAEPRPAVLVFPEGFGISEHTYGYARKLAELDYVALACDVYGGGFFNNGPVPELATHNTWLCKELGLRAAGEAALAQLAVQQEVDGARIAAVGYCIGGTIAIELGFAAAPICAIAAFHPSFRGYTLADAGNTPCSLELFLGAEDYASPSVARAEFEAALSAKGINWRMTIYGSTKHSYTNPDCQGMGDAVAFNPEAEQHSWRELKNLLERSFV